jgi:hypothetical protein
MTRYHKNKFLVTAFCDASCDQQNSVIGLGVCLAGMGKQINESELRIVKVPDPLYGELLALELSLNSLSKLLETGTFPADNLERVILFSDCNMIKRYLNKSIATKQLYIDVIDRIVERLELLSKTYNSIIFSVKYIGRRKSINYYKAAHNAARSVIGKK